MHGWLLARLELKYSIFFLKKNDNKVVASLLSFCFAKERFRKQSIKNNRHGFGGRGRYVVISLLVVGLIQDKSVITETYWDLMLSGAGWGIYGRFIPFLSALVTTLFVFLYYFVIFDSFLCSCWHCYQRLALQFE